MSKWAINGLIMIVIGGVMLGFQQLSRLMGSDGGWDAICLVDLLDPSSFDWIDAMTFLGLNNLLDTIVLAPLYLVLFVVGGILLLISGFVKS